MQTASLQKGENLDNTEPFVCEAPVLENAEYIFHCYFLQVHSGQNVSIC